MPLAVSLEPLPNRKPVTAFVQNCRPCGLDVNTKGSDTLVGRLRKAGMYPAFIHLSIYFLFYFIFFIYLFIFLLLECLWSAKMLRVENQLVFTKPHLFGKFSFHQEPVLDQTMTNLPWTTIGLKFLDFNRILF